MVGELGQLKEVTSAELADSVDWLVNFGNVADVGSSVLLGMRVPSLGLLRDGSGGGVVVVSWLLRGPWVVGSGLRCGLRCGCGLVGWLPVVVRWLAGLPGWLAWLPGWLVTSRLDPLRVLRGSLSPTVSVGGDGDESESGGEVRNHLEVLLIF